MRQFKRVVRGGRKSWPAARIGVLVVLGGWLWSGPTAAPAQQPDEKVTVEEETVREGVRIRKLSDGSTQFIRPDGTRQRRYADGTVRTEFTDGRIVTVRPDGSREVTRAPSDGESGERRPRTITPGYQSGSDGSGDHGSADDLPRVKVPLPQSTGQHADWREFEAWVKSSEAQKMRDLLDGGASGGGSSGGRSGKYVSEQELDGGIVARVRPDGGTDFFRPDGTVQRREPDGTVVTQRPDGKTIVQYPGQEPQWADSLPGGGYRYSTPDGEGSVAEIPGTGTIRVDGEGTRTLVTEEGVEIVQRPNGEKEVRGPGGKVVVSERLNDQGQVVRTGPDGGSETIDPATGRVVSRSPAPGAAGSGSGGSNSNAGSAGGGSSAGSDSGSATGSAAPPPDNIFAKASRVYDEFRRNPDLLDQQRQQLQQQRESLQQLAPSGANYQRRRRKYESDLEEFRRTLRQIQAVDEIRRNTYNPPPLDDEGNVLPDDGEADAAADQQQDLRQRQNQLQMERDSITQEEFAYSLAKQTNDQEQWLLDLQLQNAQNSIDLSLYNYCPNGAPWDQCDHPAEKQQWLADQLDRLLGPNYWDRYVDAASKKQELENQKFILDQRKRNLARDAGWLKEDADSLRADTRVLEAQTKGLNNQLEKYQAASQQYSSQFSRLKAEMDKLAAPR